MKSLKEKQKTQDLLPRQHSTGSRVKSEIPPHPPSPKMGKDLKKERRGKNYQLARSVSKDKPMLYIHCEQDTITVKMALQKSNSSASHHSTVIDKVSQSL